MTQWVKRFSRGMKLEEFISKYSNDLKNSRVFYIIRPNADKNIYKIGISGNNDGKGIGRFHQYLLYYGKHQDFNSCAGVKVFYVKKTNYNKNVEERNSYIHKLEVFVKRQLKKYEYVARGNEWTKAPLDKIEEIVRSFRGEDKITLKRQSKRVALKEGSMVLRDGRVIKWKA